MFSNLRQGNSVYVLEQTDHLTLKVGKIIDNKPNYAGTMDMKVKVDDKEYELTKLPYNQNIANSGSLIVTENKNDALNEVRKIKANSENIVNNFDYYKQNIEDCDIILKEYDSAYAKEQKQQEEINGLKQQNEELKSQISNMAQSLSNIEKLLSNKKDN